MIHPNSHPTYTERQQKIIDMIDWILEKYKAGAIALSVVLQAAVVHLPFLNDAFGTTPLGGEDWLICVGLASVVLWADEVKKLAGRWLRRK